MAALPGITNGAVLIKNLESSLVKGLDYIKIIYHWRWLDIQDITDEILQTPFGSATSISHLVYHTTK